MSDTLYSSSNPYPAPTPYLGPTQGGNVFVPTGALGAPIPTTSMPMSSGGNLALLSSTGAVQQYPVSSEQSISNIQTPTQQTIQQTTAPTGLDPHINPATGLWDDNYYAQTHGDSGSGIDTGAITNQINSGYDAYFAQLNDILNSNLPAQQQALLGGAESQYGQGVNSLDTQRALQQQGLTAQKGTVQGQQKKTLADIANNIRNSFMAGNIYLGARGAGDSSAANQYSYALTKMGSQQRGDVNAQYAGIQNEIAGRENALATTYSGALKDLEFQKNQRVNEVAQWFNEQQSALKQAVASGQLQKSQDLASLSTNLLNFAQQQLQTAQAEIANKRSMLDQWAMNNATTIQGLKQNLASVGSQVAYTNPIAKPLAGINQTTGSALAYAAPGYGTPTEDKKLFPYTG